MPAHCRYLFGDVDATVYDWQGEPAKHSKDLQDAELCSQGTAEVGSVAALYPDACNVHSFKAHTASAMLDVLIPGYTDGVSRLDCILHDSDMNRDTQYCTCACLVTACEAAR